MVARDPRRTGSGPEEAVSRGDAEAGSGPSAPAVVGHGPAGPAPGPRHDGAAEDARPAAGPAEPAAEPAEQVKPRLRGRLHAGMVPVSLVAGIVLICRAGEPRAVLACTVYSATAWLLFGTSAVYHLGTWGPLGEAVLRRLDHANIFLVIAGTCTPLAVLLLSPDQRSVLLWTVWTGAMAGISFRVLWVGAPRWLYTPCYLALGWAPVGYLPDFLRGGGAAVVSLIVTGGLLYSAGAAVYALRRPDPSPRWFGFHEVFHALTVAASAAHCTAVFLAVHRS